MDAANVSNVSLADQLRLLGLGTVAITVYICLLESGPLSTQGLADRSRCSFRATRAGAEELSNAGLVLTRLGAEGEIVYAPAPPDVGVEMLASRRQSELHEAVLSATRAYDKYRRVAHPAFTHDVVELMTGPDLPERIDQLVMMARSEVRALDSPPYILDDLRNPTQEKQMAEGIAYRVVYSRACLERPGLVTANIGPSIRAGEQARLLPEVPVKLTIVDRRMALVSLAIGEADVNHSVLVVYPCSLLTALEGLFETSWRVALPLDPNGVTYSPWLSGDHSKILNLLAAGMSDDAIARELGISRRTYFRRLSGLMTQAGAMNRFQLALCAARNKWC